MKFPPSNPLDFYMSSFLGMLAMPSLALPKFHGVFSRYVPGTYIAAPNHLYFHYQRIRSLASGFAFSPHLLSDYRSRLLP